MTSLFDTLSKLSKTNEQEFLEVGIDCIKYVLKDLKKHPDKYLKAGIVCLMPEWKSVDGEVTRMKKWLTEELELLEGKREKSTIRFLQYHWINGKVFMVKNTLDDFHELAHHQAMTGKIQADWLFFGEEIRKRIEKD